MAVVAGSSAVQKLLKNAEDLTALEDARQRARRRIAELQTTIADLDRRYEDASARISSEFAQHFELQLSREYGALPQEEKIAFVKHVCRLNGSHVAVDAALGGR